MLFYSELFRGVQGVLFFCRKEKVVPGRGICVPGRGICVPERGTCVPGRGTENISGEGNIYIREGEKSTVEQIIPKEYYLL